EAEGLVHCEWLPTSRTIGPVRVPSAVVYSVTISAPSHPQAHLRGIHVGGPLLDWPVCDGRCVVYGRWSVEMEVSKVRQLSALMAFGIDVPKTIAVIGRDPLKDSARSVPLPFITKLYQGGKGLGVRRFDDLEDFDSYVDSDDFEAPV